MIARCASDSIVTGEMLIVRDVNMNNRDFVFASTSKSSQVKSRGEEGGRYLLPASKINAHRPSNDKFQAGRHYP